MSEKVLVTPADVSNLTNNGPIVLIDTRDPAAYAVGHLPGAVNIHDIFTYLATSTPEGVAAMRHQFASIFGATGLSGNETAIVYEQSMNTGFGQSCRGYVLLNYLGYPKVKILQAAMQRGRRPAYPSPPRLLRPRRPPFRSIPVRLAFWSICRP